MRKATASYNCLLILITVSGCGEPTLPEIGPVGMFGRGGLDSVLGSIIQVNDVPALAAFTTRIERAEDGDSLVAKSDLAVAGVRSDGTGQPVTNDDLWHLGSLTKSMTASLAARLVDRNLIDWSTTVSEVFPELVGTMETEYEAASLDQLLSHTSGLPEDVTGTPSWPELRNSTLPLDEQRRAWIEELLALPAGTTDEYVYSDAGYVVAGAMLERVTGLIWEDLMVNEIFVPLGMNGAGFGPPGTTGTVDQPRGHQLDGETWLAVEPGPLADNPQAMGPAGTVHASLNDLIRYGLLHLMGARDSSDFFDPTTWDKLHTSFPGAGYALGWGIDRRTWANGTVLAHTGSNTMWYAVIWIAPERNLVMAAVTNAAGPDFDDEGARRAERATDQAIQAMILRAGLSLQ